MNKASSCTAFCLAAALSLSMQAADFSKEMARLPPDWARDGVIYEIYVPAFSPTHNLAGVTARLDDLKALGVNVLWLMPIHPNGELKKKGTYGSPYAVRDYDAIDPAYGAAADMHKLVTEAHRRDLKIIIDIVPNHTAWDSVLMKHPEFYKKDAAGNIIAPIPEWGDVAGLDYRNPQLREYMISMLERWIRDFDLDGFRCDAAGMVPTDFWETVPPRLTKLKPDILLLAEWSSPDLFVKSFDLDYAWPFHKTLTEVLQDGKPASAIRETLEQERAHYPQGALHMNFSDNHDEKRALARFGEKGALAASALVFALPGVPMIYNGMEAGDTTESGGPALFERLPVFWSIAERRPEFRKTYESLIRLRKQHVALRRGELTWLTTSDDTRIVSFARKSAGEEIVFVVNLSNRPFAGAVKGVAGSGFVELEKGSAAAFDSVALDAWGWRWYQRAEK